MEKKKYEKPEIEITETELDDVILESSAGAKSFGNDRFFDWENEIEG